MIVTHPSTVADVIPWSCTPAKWNFVTRRILATSREILDIPGDTAFPLFASAAATYVLDPQRSLAALDDAVALAERVMPDAVEFLRGNRCLPLAQLGRIEEARKVIESMLAGAANHESPLRTSQLWSAGTILMSLSDSAGARGILEATLPGLERYPCKQPLQWTYDFLSRCCFELGALGDARAYALRGIEMSRT